MVDRRMVEADAAVATHLELSEGDDVVPIPCVRMPDGAPTAAASAGAYFARGEIVPDICGPTAVGSDLGALLGARLLMIIPNAKLRLLFVTVLVAFSVQMLLAAVGVVFIGGGA